MKETSSKERASYYLYFLGQNMSFFVVNMYAMLFFTDRLGISAAVVGTLFFVARIWAAANDLMFGVIVDKSNIKSGKYKPWLNLASLTLPIITVSIFAIPDISIAGKITLASVTYILWGMAYTVSDVPGFSIITAMTANTNERNTMLSLSRMFALSGLLVVSVVLMPIVNSFGWTTAAVCISAVSFLLMNLQRFFVKERHFARNESISIGKIFKCLFNNKYLLIYYGAITVWFSCSTGMLVSSYFAVYNLGSHAYIGILMIFMVVPLLMTSIFVPPLIRKFGKNKVVLVSAITNITIFVTFYIIGYSNIMVVFLMMILNGLCSGVLNITYPMYTADCIEYGAWKTGERTTGISFSIQTFTTKLAQAVSAGAGGLLLTAFGYVPNVEQSEKTLKGIFSMMTLIPATGVLGFVIIFGLFYKLKESDVEKYIEENMNTMTRKNNN
jgi:GPH family glycoside/pentoside/hexuronide:cation symporter